MKNTTIKVSKTTAKRLHRIVGELTKNLGRRVTLEEAIVYLLENSKTAQRIEGLESKMIDDRKKILSLMQKKFYGIHSDDLKEYDYNDIGG
ncbi:MAG: hypothetical protein GF383_08295 [Candidatus Lokiarchaeota archaeon]|nr:hypothetical protein [Candidatus Lokiarchaeota archaeon]MBD3340351.1 hypothetical protein [Candidatus Lokiarchaeota archaeon]